MTPHRGIFLTLGFILLRFTPVLAPFFVLDLSSQTHDDYLLLVNRTLRFIAVLIVWGMTEGVCMLWIREKNAGSANARGFGIVTIIAAAFVLGFLQVFRIQSSQLDFLMLLSCLALLGMTRGGWEQGRPHISLITSMAAHTLIASLAFLLALHQAPWQALVIAASIGTLLGAIESAWYGYAFKGFTFGWILPVRRLGLVSGPLLITTGAIAGVLPPIYIALFLVTLLGGRVARTMSFERLIAGQELLSIAGIYVLFMGIMVTCRVLQ